MYKELGQKLSSKNIFSNAGFSIIEIIFVLAIIAIMTSLVIPRKDGFSGKIDLENAAISIDSKIKLAKSRSISALDGNKHGIHFEPNRVVIFQDDIYVEGAAENEVFIFSDKIEINLISLAGGGDDLIFKRLTGETENFGTIGIRVINEPSSSRQIIINTDGQSSFNTFSISSGSLIQNARHVHFDLGWLINSSETLHLRWVDGSESEIISNDIEIASYFDAGNNIFDWEGTTTVNSVEQSIRIYGWEESGSTVLCIMRENTEEEKLYVYSDDGTFNFDIAVYENNGVQVDVDGGVMTIK